MSFDNAVMEWDQGLRRLAAAPPEMRPALERVIDRVVIELRRRLGSRFTTDELAELYGRGTDWTLDLAVQVAPEDPSAWDQSIVADAAFARYLRSAADYAGGQRTERE